MAYIASAGSADTKTTEQKYLDALKKYAPEMKQLNGTSLTANALANTTSPTLASVKSVYDNLYNKQTTPTATTPTVAPTATPTVSTQTVAPLQTQSPTPQQTVAQVSPQFDVQAYMNQLAEAKKAQQIAGLQNAYNKNISSINSQDALIDPQAYTDRGVKSTASQLSAKNLAEYMASRGQTNAGVAGQSELNRNMQLQGDIGAIDLQARNQHNTLANQKTELGSALQNDIASANAGVDSQLMQNLIDQYNADRTRQDALDQFAKTYGLETSKFDYGKTRDSVSDQRYADETSYNKSRDEIADSRYNQEYKDSQAAQNLENQYKQQQILEAKYANEISKAKSKYATQFALSQLNEQKFNESYAKARATGYSEEQAASIALKNAQAAKANTEASNDTRKTNYDVGKPYYNPKTGTNDNTKYNYKDDASFKTTYAAAIKDQAGSLAKLKADPAKFITAFGLDGFKALYTAASPKSSTIDFSFLDGLQ